MIIHDCLATKTNAKVIHSFQNKYDGHGTQYYSGYDLEAKKAYSVSSGLVWRVSADSVVVSYNTTTCFVYSKLKNIQVTTMQTLAIGDLIGETRAGELHIEYLIPLVNEWPVRVSDILTLYKHDPYPYLVNPIDRQSYVVFNTDTLDLTDGSFVESYVAFVGSDQVFLLGDQTADNIKGSAVMYDSSLFSTWGSVAGDAQAIQNAFTATAVEPMKIAFWFGINEILDHTFSSPSAFGKAYKQTIDAFTQNMTASCLVYAISIPKFATPFVPAINQYNAVIEKICKDNNYTYIDITMDVEPLSVHDLRHFTDDTNTSLVQFFKKSIGFREDDEAPYEDAELISPSTQILDRFVSSIIDSLNLNPYIATLSRETPKWLKIDKLRDHKVCAVIIEAGCLFNTVHQPVDFRSPLVDAQAKAAIAENMPFGLYFTSRARSESEALEEMYQLAFIIRKYPPKLGVWVKTEFKVKLDRNTQVLQAYEKVLVRLGLIGKIGIWCDRNQLKLFDWDSLQSTWYLWLDESVKSKGDLDVIADPAMFDTDGEGELHG